MTVPVETNPFPPIERRTDPFGPLAAAVISQAVQDATSGFGSNRNLPLLGCFKTMTDSLFGVMYWELISSISARPLQFVGFPNRTKLWRFSVSA